MSTFFERFLLSLLVALCAAVIIANPFKFDTTQRVSVVLGIAFVALFASRTIERSKEASTAAPVSVPTQQKAQVSAPPRATPDAGASVGFDLFKILSSPKLSPEWRSRVLEYIDVRTQLNQTQAEMDESSAKLDAEFTALDGAPPKTPTS